LERDGTDIVSPDVQRYVNPALVHFVEEECGFIVVEGIHRVIAVVEMFRDGELCLLPEDFVSVVLRPGMAPELLWRVSWALNGIGHNIVELSVFDWLAAIRRQRNEIFAEGNIPARITQAGEIDSKTIAERFESISGTQIYGISNWREWCSLERALGPNTMKWLGEV